MATTITRSFHQKVQEQIERLQHLVSLISDDTLDWRPPGPGEAFTMGELLGHLLECLAGFCAVLYALKPDRLTYFSRLRELPVNHRCAPAEASVRIRQYGSHIDEGFALIDDDDLARPAPTVFVPEGETAATLLIGAFEHLVNHKQQLFQYLKALGVNVATRDLYQLK